MQLISSGDQRPPIIGVSIKDGWCMPLAERPSRAGKAVGLLLTSAVDGRYIADHTSLDMLHSGAETYKITDLGDGKGYSLMKENGKFLGIGSDGTINILS
jgi:hypothetical protein